MSHRRYCLKNRWLYRRVLTVEYTPWFSIDKPLNEMEQIMPNLPTRKPSDSKRLAWITGILCVACCAAPLVVVAFGSAGIAALSMYSEMAAGVALIFGIGILLYQRFTRRKAPACDTDCGCKLKSQNLSENSKD